MQGRVKPRRNGKAGRNTRSYKCAKQSEQPAVFSVSGRKKEAFRKRKERGWNRFQKI